MKKILLFTALFFLFGLLIFVYYQNNPAAQKSFFPSCPTHTILGIYCPGCGSQRALHYVLHGEVGKAFRYNPFFVIMAPVALVLIFQKLYQYFSGQRLQIKIFENARALRVLFLIVCLYFVLRNVPLAVFDVLRPPARPL